MVKKIDDLVSKKLKEVDTLMERRELAELFITLREANIISNPAGGTVISLSQGETNIAGIAAALAIIYSAYKLSKGFAQRLKPKKCRQYKLGSPAQKKCHHEVDVVALEKVLNILQSKIGLCKHSKDEQKCANKIKKKISEIQQKISIKKAKIKELQFLV